MRINVIEVDAPLKEELASLISKGKVIIDGFEQVIIQVKLMLLCKGVITEANIYVEVGEMVVSKKKLEGLVVK